VGGKAVEYYCKQDSLFYKAGCKCMWHDETDKERFVFSDLTVADKVTGLMWTRDANIADKKMTWYDASKFIEGLNKQKYDGYNNWRLPTKWELQTLVDYASQKHAEYDDDGCYTDLQKLLNEIGFKNVQGDGYWSSATDDDTIGAGGVYMGVGRVFAYIKSGNYYVWPIRGGQ
jgi:hypothetical protein